MSPPLVRVDVAESARDRLIRQTIEDPDAIQAVGVRPWQTGKETTIDCSHEVRFVKDMRVEGHMATWTVEQVILGRVRLGPMASIRLERTGLEGEHRIRIRLDSAHARSTELNRAYRANIGTDRSGTLQVPDTCQYAWESGLLRLPTPPCLVEIDGISCKGHKRETDKPCDRLRLVAYITGPLSAGAESDLEAKPPWIWDPPDGAP